MYYCGNVPGKVDFNDTHDIVGISVNVDSLPRALEASLDKDWIRTMVSDM